MLGFCVTVTLIHLYYLHYSETIFGWWIPTLSHFLFFFTDNRHSIDKTHQKIFYKNANMHVDKSFKWRLHSCPEIRFHFSLSFIFLFYFVFRQSNKHSTRQLMYIHQLIKLQCIRYRTRCSFIGLCLKKKWIVCHINENGHNQSKKNSKV